MDNFVGSPSGSLTKYSKAEAYFAYSNWEGIYYLFISNTNLYGCPTHGRVIPGG